MRCFRPKINYLAFQCLIYLNILSGINKVLIKYHLILSNKALPNVSIVYISLKPHHGDSQKQTSINKHTEVTRRCNRRRNITPDGVWQKPHPDLMVPGSVLLTAAGLHTDLQAQVVSRAHHPQVTGGCDLKLQPALLSSPEPARLQQEQVCLSETRKEAKEGVWEERAVF